MKVSDQENFIISAKINLNSIEDNPKNLKNSFSFKTSFTETVSSFILIKNDKKSYNNALVIQNETTQETKNENSVYKNYESSGTPLFPDHNPFKVYEMANNVYTSMSNGITKDTVTRHFTLTKKRPKRIFRQGKSHFRSQYQASTVSTQSDVVNKVSNPTM